MTNYSPHQGPIQNMNGNPGWNYQYNPQPKQNIWKWLLPLLTGIGGLIIGLIFGGLLAAGNGPAAHPKSIYEAFKSCNVDMDSSAVDIPAPNSDAEIYYDPSDKTVDLVTCSLNKLRFSQEQVDKVIDGDHKDANNGSYRIRNIKGPEPDEARLMIWKVDN